MEPGAIFASPGALGPLMAAHDWSGTPVGPVDGWPESLRSTVKLLLRSRYPMVLTWGPEYTQFYNDAYAQLIGDLHPGALGTDIRATLAEGWDVLGPIVEETLRTGVASWVPALLLALDRAGYREEAYFSVSHAAVTDDVGETAGMFGVCSEVTEQVIGERRLRLLRDVPAGAGEERTVAAVCRDTIAAFARHALDVPFAAILLRGPDGLRPAGTVGLPGDLPPLPAMQLAHAEAGGLATIAIGAESGLTGGPWDAPVHTAVALPLPGSGVLLAGVNPGRALDDDHRGFFELLAAQLAAALRSARAAETEQRRLQELAALDRARTEFFSNVSHEFRTPLTLLLGPLDDALDDREVLLPDAQRTRVELARRNGRRLLTLVNGLLDFARLEGGAVRPDTAPVDLARATSDIAALFRAAIERAGLTLEVDCPEPGPVTEVDRDLWEQVVLNLLSNAFKYTFTGTIRVAVRTEGECAVLEVSDTGIGIAPEHLPGLFDRFSRVRSDRARTHEGTGIGLALVRDIARLHDGEARVESEVGGGSRFTVALPLRAAAETAVAAPSRRTAMAVEVLSGWTDAATVAAAGPADAPLVLVVDDNADMRAYLERILQPHFRVRSAGDGEAALAAVADQPPDLVLTDVMMPRLDGFAFLDALRRAPRTATLPVIVLSARSGADAAVEVLSRGADDHLAKPFAAQELIARIHANLDREPRPVPLAPAPPRSAPSGREPEAVHDGDALVLRMPAEARHIGWMRRQLRGLLRDGELPAQEVDDLVLATCEAVTNSIEHAQDVAEPTITLSIQVRDGRAHISVQDTGRWLPRGPSYDRGRGSQIMEAVADVRIEPSAAGTTVSLSSRR